MKKGKSIDLTLISQLILSILVLVIGIVVTIFKSFGLLDLNLYISILFYVYAFFSTLLYFVKRKEGDYELLILSLINIITASFMFVFKNDNTPMILGAAMTIYTVLLILNRGYKITVLQKNNNFMWIVKFIVTFLIAFLGILTSFNLFNEVTVQTLMFGFYFITLGFLLIVESLLEMFITDTAFKKFLAKILIDDSNKLEEIEVKESKKETPKKVKKEKKEIKEETKKETVKKVNNKTKTTNKNKTEEPKRKPGRLKKNS